MVLEEGIDDHVTMHQHIVGLIVNAHLLNNDQHTISYVKTPITYTYPYWICTNE